MKQKEFLQLIDQYGFNLNKLSIAIGEASGWEGAHGVYFKNGTWFYYSADGRNHIDESALENEDEAFEKMMKYVFLDLDTKRYLTKIIDEDIVKIGKETVCRFIQEKYAMSEQQANDAWTYLRQDMHVLFEFKYYVAKGNFVPDKYCYKVQGYSAEQLHTTTYLEVLGAFNYLIYLGTKPQEALANLKKGLPRRKNFSDKDLEEVQKTMNRKKLKEDLIKEYPIGTRIKLISLVNYEPRLPANSIGTVRGHDDYPSLLMRWDNGSSLSLLPSDGDKFEKLSDDITSLAIPPGETIKELLEHNSLEEGLLAAHLNMTKNELNELICGRKELTKDIAIKLEKRFDISASFWLSLEEMYRNELTKM